MMQNRQASPSEKGFMLNALLQTLNNRNGSVINVALLILILIFLIGIGLHKISTTDIKIATNIKTDTVTFYGAESGLDAASELLELNADCPVGFRDKTLPADDGLPAGQEEIEGRIVVTNLSFWHNDHADDPNPYRPDGTFDNTLADAYYPIGADRAADSTDEYTNLSFGGAIRFSRGSAIQMAAGYEGLGKGAAGGGATALYDIIVYQHGRNRSSAKNYIQWGHKIGLGETCKY